MKDSAIQQEILLLNNTTFSNREWCSTGLSRNAHRRSFKKRLEEAVWNDLLDQMLPEISEKSISGVKLYPWNIRQGRAFLEIELGNHPELVERRFSIDPYIFLPVACAS